MGKIDISLRLSSLPAGAAPNKTDPRLDHGMPPAKNVQAGDQVADFRVRLGEIPENEMRPVIPGSAQQAGSFLSGRSRYHRIIISENRFRQMGRQALVGRHHIAKRRAVINDIVPGNGDPGAGDGK